MFHNCKWKIIKTFYTEPIKDIEMLREIRCFPYSDASHCLKAIKGITTILCECSTCGKLQRMDFFGKEF